MTDVSSERSPAFAPEIVRLLRAFEHASHVRRSRIGLNANEDAVLLLLAGGMHAPSEIGRTIGMTSAGVTNLVDRLEKAGLVRRERHRSDKRRVLLMLTKRGFASHLELEEVADALAARTTPGTAIEQFLGDAADYLERLTPERPD